MVDLAVTTALTLLTAAAWAHIAGIVVCCLAEGFYWDVVKRESYSEQPILTVIMAVASVIPLGLWTDWFRRDAFDTWKLAVAGVVALAILFVVQQWLERRGWDTLAARALQAGERADAAGHDPRRFYAIADAAEHHRGLLRDWKRELRALEQTLTR